MKNIPVLIVGAGPVGLSMALALARQKIKSVVIERHSGFSNHPKARGVNIRTIEIFRQWGNAASLLQHELPKESRRFIWVKSFQGEEVTRVSMDDTSTCRFSPTYASFVPQDKIEESLYHALLKNEEMTEIQFSKALVSFDDDDSGITARTLNRNTNQEEFIHAEYLIAADGAQSQIRNQLSISMQGPDNLGEFCSVYCEMDLSTWTHHRPCYGYFFVDPKLFTRFLTSVDGIHRWIVGLRFTADSSKEQFTNEYCMNEIKALLGLPDLKIRIIDKSFWTSAAQVAEQYQKGRVFLVGDAAHRLPPTGAFGMNTGIQDAHNLAWKLAFVINQKASSALLNTYAEERAPVAIQNIQWSSENSKRFTEIYYAIHAGDMKALKCLLHDQQRHLNYSGLDLGFIYHSSIVASENDQTISVTPSEYRPTTLPGSRAPHVQLRQHDKTISTLDLFEKDFVLFIGSEGEGWRTAARELVDSLPFLLIIYSIGIDGDLIDLDDLWYENYEITSTGAVLVRPDGHVAWRSMSMVDKPKEVLMKYFRDRYLSGGIDEYSH